MKLKLPLIMVVALAALFWVVLFARTFRTLASPDQLDYAHLGRNLLAGRGYVTDIIFPLYLTRFPSLDDQPEFSRAPGFPALAAASQAVFGNTDQAVVGVSGVAYVLTVGLTLVFSARLFHHRGLAIVAALLVLVNQEVVTSSQAGLADLSFAFWLTLILLLVYEEAHPLLVGGAIGLGYLLRYNLLVMLPGLALFWWWARPRLGWRYIVTVFGVAALVALPWLLRNAALAGSPTFTWPVYNYVMGTSIYPGQNLYRQIEAVSILSFVLEHPGEMIAKSVSSLRFMYNELPGLTTFLVSAFFAASTFPADPNHGRAGALQRTILAMAGCQALALIPFEHEKIRLFHAFIPSMCVFASRWLNVQLLASGIAGWRHIAALASLVAVVSLPTWPEFTGATYRRDFEEAAANLRAVGARVEADAVIVSDQPWALTWYLGYRTVNIPVRYADLLQIEALADAPVYIYFYYLGERDRYHRADEYRTQYLNHPAFLDGHTLVETFDDGSLLFRASD